MGGGGAGRAEDKYAGTGNEWDRDARWERHRINKKEVFFKKTYIEVFKINRQHYLGLTGLEMEEWMETQEKTGCNSW